MAHLHISTLLLACPMLFLLQRSETLVRTEFAGACPGGAQRLEEAMNEDTRSETVVGVFEDKEQVDRAVDGLRRAGFSDESIGVAIHDSDAAVGDTTVSEVDERVTETPRAGAITGGLVGGIAGAAAVGLIPGVGPVLAAGALAGILGGATIGSGIGWVAGSLTNIGLDEENAHLYAQEFHSGRHLVTVAAGDRPQEAREILARHGAYGIERGGTGTVQDRPRFGRWEDVQSSFRERWERRHGETGADWEEHDSHYRFGWEMAREPQYRDRDWSEVEPELRHQWELDQSDTPWERAMNSLREAWDEMRDTGSPLMEPEEARRRKDRAA